MKTVLVPLDSPGLVERLKADLIAMYQPVNSQELLAIERIVAAQQALRRCSILENSLFATCYEVGEDSADAPENPDPPRVFTFGYNPVQVRAFNAYLRFQAQAERMYRRAVEDLERLISFREEFAESEEDVEDAEPLPTPSLLAMMPRLQSAIGRSISLLHHATAEHPGTPARSHTPSLPDAGSQLLAST